MNDTEKYDVIEMIDVERWVDLGPGEFSFDACARYFLRGEFDNLASATYLMMILEAMVKQGLLERVGNKRGWYRPPQTDLVAIDLKEADDTPLEIWMPFAMHNLVNVLPGNIITIGGEKNAGKTAYLLNLAFDNRDKFKVHYFNSEMGAGEVKLRCKKYCESNRVVFSEWLKVNFYERSDNFSDVIFTGKGVMNIIDFYECHDEFYRMGDGIRKIHDRLDGAVCFVAIQKNPGNDDPVGGRRVTEKSRVHLNITQNWGARHPHRAKITVGKNWADPLVNPCGYYVDYKLANGCYLKPATDPHDPTKCWMCDD